LDAADVCPDENPSGYDANGDGCIDRLEDLPRVIREETSLAKRLQLSLTAMVNRAIAARERGSVRAARQMLAGFCNRVRAQRGKKVSQGDADLLIAFATNASGGLQSSGESRSLNRRAPGNR
jgi:hypothetical protein